MFGAVEAGGTKFVCAVGTGPFDVHRSVRIPTTTPQETLASVTEFLSESDALTGVGVASFGPVELRKSSVDYGHFGNTPKPGWSGADLLAPIESATGAPVELQTDVVGAAIAEWRWGAGAGCRSIVYMTVGTGIGGGIVVDGVPLAGLVHSEMGHVVVERHPNDTYAGGCPFHGDCLEGMASGPAIAERWGRPGQELGDLTEEAMNMEAHYLASGLRSVVYALAPERIVVGGGVSSLPGLVDTVGQRLLDQLGGYGVHDEHKDGFVVPPGLGAGSGLAGAFALAEQAAVQD